MTVIIQLTITGIAMGMIYALMAMGLILLIRAVNVMNFAQGDLLAFGAFITQTMFFQMDLPGPIAMAISIGCMVLLGIFFMVTCYWPLREASYPVAAVISTMGASIAIKEAIMLIWGSAPLRAKPLISGVIRIGGVVLQIQYLMIIVIVAIIMFLVFILFEKIYAGRMMQAAAQDKYAASLIGIPVMLTIMVTYCIVTTLAGIGGYLTAPLFMASTTLSSMQLRAFAGCVIGGFGNIKGAILGSVLIGLVEAYSTLFTTTYKDAVVFLILIAVLLIRPQGIMGERIADKA